MAEAVKSFRIDMWLARHTPEKTFPIVTKVINAAKNEFADAVSNGGGVYAVGYCFGGKYVMLLAGENPDSSDGTTRHDEEQGVPKSGPLIKAGAVAHGIYVPAFTTIFSRMLFLANPALYSIRCDTERYRAYFGTSIYGLR